MRNKTFPISIMLSGHGGDGGRMPQGDRDRSASWCGGATYTPTPYTLAIPPNFSAMPIPADNPFTVEGIRLGRFLFYDERLSGNNTQSCAMPCPSERFQRPWATVQCGH